MANSNICLENSIWADRATAFDGVGLAHRGESLQ